MKKNLKNIVQSEILKKKIFISTINNLFQALHPLNTLLIKFLCFYKSMTTRSKIKWGITKTKKKMIQITVGVKPGPHVLVGPHGISDVADKTNVRGRESTVDCQWKKWRMLRHENDRLCLSIHWQRGRGKWCEPRLSNSGEIFRLKFTMNYSFRIEIILPELNTSGLFMIFLPSIWVRQYFLISHLARYLLEQTET